MNPIDSNTDSSPSELARGAAWRWWGFALGIVSGVADTLGLRAFGIPLELGGRDVTWIVAAYFAASFALVGYLVGRYVEQRRRERHLEEQMRRQVEMLADLRGRLAQSEKLAALGQLAASIAHEVRNPLGVIRSAAQGIGETLADDDAERREACSFIEAEIDRLNTVISSLLAFARPLQIAARPTAVADLVARAALLAETDLDKKRIRLRHIGTDEAPLVRADPDLATQMLVDLLDNAREVSRPEGEVTITARAHDAIVELEVHDEGPGVPAELRERIFEPFFSTRPQGTGLGLAVARQIAEAHGGRLEIGNGARRGTSFVLSLPRAEPGGRVG